MKKSIATIIFCLLTSSQAFAAACDYKPSELVGDVVTTATITASSMAAGAGVVAKSAGIYSITHSVTGAAMLGSTAAGASAAGTTGIIAGTAGVLGSIGAVILSPAFLISAGVVAVGGAGYEAGCYLLADDADVAEPADDPEENSSSN